MGLYLFTILVCHYARREIQRFYYKNIILLFYEKYEKKTTTIRNRYVGVRYCNLSYRYTNKSLYELSLFILCE